MATLSTIPRWSSASCARSCRSRRPAPSRAPPRSSTSPSQRCPSPSAGSRPSSASSCCGARATGVELTEAGAVVFERAREVIAGRRRDPLRPRRAARPARGHGRARHDAAARPDRPARAAGALPRRAPRDRRPRPGRERAGDHGAASGAASSTSRSPACAPTGSTTAWRASRCSSEELLLIAPPEHDLGTPSLADLSSVPFIAYRRGSALRDTIDAALPAWAPCRRSCSRPTSW